MKKLFCYLLNTGAIFKSKEALNFTNSRTSWSEKAKGRVSLKGGNTTNVEDFQCVEGDIKVKWTEEDLKEIPTQS